MANSTGPGAADIDLPQGGDGRLAEGSNLGGGARLQLFSLERLSGLLKGSTGHVGEGLDAGSQPSSTAASSPFSASLDPTRVS